MIRLVCPKCNKLYEVDDQWAGTQVRCDLCGARFVIPSATFYGEKAPAPVQQPVWNGSAAPVEAPVQQPVWNGSAAPVEAPVQQPVWNGSAAPVDAPVNHDKIVISFDDVPQERVRGEAMQAPVSRGLSPRQRRLQADFRMMQERFTSFPYIHLVATQGEPADKYIVDFNVKGIERLEGERIIYRHNHRVEIVLPGTYPRTPPTCRMLTPIFHPNIEPAVICIGDHWTAAERLCDLVVRIGEIITYQSYNIKSPLDGEAAMWADLHESILPIDNCDLMPPEE